MSDPTHHPSAEHPSIESNDGQMLLTYLAQRDVPCPACRYNIRGLTQPSCPECGKRLELRVGLTEGISGSWITALVASLLPAGCGLPFNILLLIGFGSGLTLSELVSEPEVWPFLALLLYAGACVPISITLLACRHRFLRLQQQAQSSIAATLVLCDVIAILVLIVGFGRIMS